MRMVGALFLTLSAITPASSVFVIVPGVISQAGTGAFYSLIIGALVGVAMAFVYAELASAFPLSGGEYALIGRALGPFSGFLIMGTNAFNTTIQVSALSVGAAPYLAPVMPNADPVLLGIAITILATLMSIFDIRTNAWITGVFLAIEVLALIVLTQLGLGHASRPLSELFLHPVVLHDGVLANSSLASIALGTSVAAFAYNGFGAAVYFAEEMHEAPTLIARTIIWALGLTVLLEFVPVTAVLLGAPDLAQLLGSENPFTEFLRETGGRAVTIAIGLGVAASIVNAVLATILMNARFFYSTGRDGVWPVQVNDILTWIHRRFHSPWIATILGGALSVLFCFLPLDVLLVLNGAGIIFMYVFLCAATISGRRSGRTDHAPYRMPWHPWPSLFALAALALVIVANWMDESVGRPSLIVTVAVMMGTGMYYFFVVRRRGVWVLKGPEDL